MLHCNELCWYATCKQAIHTLHRMLQASLQLAAFEMCRRWDKGCTPQDTLDLPLKANVAYAFIARGSAGRVGRLEFSLRCGSTAGLLPAWVASPPAGVTP